MMPWSLTMSIVAFRLCPAVSGAVIPGRCEDWPQKRGNRPPTSRLDCLPSHSSPQYFKKLSTRCILSPTHRRLILTTRWQDMI